MAITVWPNPVKDKLFWDTDIKIKSLNLMDVNAQIFNMEDIEFLPAGLYYLVLIDNDENVYHHQFVKM